MAEENKPLTLNDKYKLKGAQQFSLADYEALKAKQEKGSKFKIPTVVKYILAAPFLLVFVVGILFIPYILYLIATSPSAPEKPEQEESISYEDLAQDPK